VYDDILEVTCKNNCFISTTITELAECDVSNWIHRWRARNEREACSIAYTVNSVWNIANQVVRALHALHVIDLIHGDIKSCNYLILPGARVVLTDWSFTRRSYLHDHAPIPSPSLDFSAISWWNKDTFAPEMLPLDDYGKCRRSAHGCHGDKRTGIYATNKAYNSQAADIWGLGVLLLELFTGHRPAQLVTPIMPDFCMQHYRELHTMPKSIMFGPPRMKSNVSPPAPYRTDELATITFGTVAIKSDAHVSTTAACLLKSKRQTKVNSNIRRPYLGNAKRVNALHLRSRGAVTTKWTTCQQLRNIWKHTPRSRRPRWTAVDDAITDVVQLLQACFAPRSQDRPTAVTILYHVALTGRLDANGQNRGSNTTLDAQLAALNLHANCTNEKKYNEMQVQRVSVRDAWQHTVRVQLNLTTDCHMTIPTLGYVRSYCSNSVEFTSINTSPVMVHWWSDQRPRCVRWAWQQVQQLGSHGSPFLWLLFTDALDRLVLGGHPDIRRFIAGYDFTLLQPHTPNHESAAPLHDTISKPICTSLGTCNSSTMPVASELELTIHLPHTPKNECISSHAHPVSCHKSTQNEPTLNLNAQLISVDTYCISECDNITVNTIFIPSDTALLQWMQALMHMLIVCELDDHSIHRCFLKTCSTNDSNHMQMLIMSGLAGCLQRPQFHPDIFKSFQGQSVEHASARALQIVTECSRHPSRLPIPSLSKLQSRALSYLNPPEVEQK
jgi:serine/threonine protein kinase